MSSELDNMTRDDCGEDLERADWSDSDLPAAAATNSHELTDAQLSTILAALRYWLRSIKALRGAVPRYLLCDGLCESPR